MLHLHGSVGEKTSDDLFPLELDWFHIHLLKNYSIGAVRNVLELSHYAHANSPIVPFYPPGNP